MEGEGTAACCLFLLGKEDWTGENRGNGGGGCLLASWGAGLGGEGGEGYRERLELQGWGQKPKEGGRQKKFGVVVRDTGMEPRDGMTYSYRDGLERH